MVIYISTYVGSNEECEEDYSKNGVYPFFSRKKTMKVCCLSTHLEHSQDQGWGGTLKFKICNPAVATGPIKVISIIISARKSNRVHKQAKPTTRIWFIYRTLIINYLPIFSWFSQTYSGRNHLWSGTYRGVPFYDLCNPSTVSVSFYLSRLCSATNE